MPSLEAAAFRNLFPEKGLRKSGGVILFGPGYPFRSGLSFGSPAPGIPLRGRSTTSRTSRHRHPSRLVHLSFHPFHATPAQNHDVARRRVSHPAPVSERPDFLPALYGPTSAAQEQGHPIGWPIAWPIGRLAAFRSGPDPNPPATSLLRYPAQAPALLRAFGAIRPSAPRASTR